MQRKGKIARLPLALRIKFWLFGWGWVCLQRLPEQISLITRYTGTGRRFPQLILGNIHANLIGISHWVGCLRPAWGLF